MGGSQTGKPSKAFTVWGLGGPGRARRAAVCRQFFGAKGISERMCLKRTATEREKYCVRKSVCVGARVFVVFVGIFPLLLCTALLPFHRPLQRGTLARGTTVCFARMM